MADPIKQETEAERIAKLRPSSDAQACIEAGLLLGSQGVQILAPDGVPLPPAIVVRDGFKVELRPDLLPNPARAKGTVTFDDVDSFCRYFKKYKDADSVIIVSADPQGKQGATFTGILNYHSTTKAAHGDFRCCYTAKLSVEWQKWMSRDRVPMAHLAFLEHLDDVKKLIVEPDGAGLLDLIGSLEGKVSARFENAKNLHNGRMILNYSEDVEMKAGQPVGSRPGTMEVPEELVAALPVFEFSDVADRIVNKLRYRMANRTLSFQYEAQEVHLIVKQAVKDQVAKVNTLADCVPLYGTAPA